MSEIDFKETDQKLAKEIKALATTFVAYYPEIKVTDACPVEGCEVNFINSRLGSEYCSIHGDKLQTFNKKMPVESVLTRIQRIAGELIHDEQR